MALLPVVLAGVMGLVYVIARHSGLRGPSAPPTDAPPGTLTRAEARSLERPPISPQAGFKPTMRPIQPIQRGRIPLPFAPFPSPTATATPATPTDAR